MHSEARRKLATLTKQSNLSAVTEKVSECE